MRRPGARQRRRAELRQREDATLQQLISHTAHRRVHPVDVTGPHSEEGRAARGLSPVVRGPPDGLEARAAVPRPPALPGGGEGRWGDVLGTRPSARFNLREGGVKVVVSRGIQGSYEEVEPAGGPGWAGAPQGGPLEELLTCDARSQCGGWSRVPSATWPTLSGSESAHMRRPRTDVH